MMLDHEQVQDEFKSKFCHSGYNNLSIKWIIKKSSVQFFCFDAVAPRPICHHVIGLMCSCTTGVLYNTMPILFFLPLANNKKAFQAGRLKALILFYHVIY